MSKYEQIAQDIDKIIIKELIEYSPSDLCDIIIAMLLNHMFTTSDTIEGLIYELEGVKEQLCKN